MHSPVSDCASICILVLPSTNTFALDLTMLQWKYINLPVYFKNTMNLYLIITLYSCFGWEMWQSWYKWVKCYFLFIPMKVENSAPMMHSLPTYRCHFEPTITVLKGNIEHLISINLKIPQLMLPMYWNESKYVVIFSFYILTFISHICIIYVRFINNMCPREILVLLPDNITLLFHNNYPMQYIFNSRRKTNLSWILNI